jgi:hypothetical protein
MPAVTRQTAYNLARPVHPTEGALPTAAAARYPALGLPTYILGRHRPAHRRVDRQGSHPTRLPATLLDISPRIPLDFVGDIRL